VVLFAGTFLPTKKYAGVQSVCNQNYRLSKQKTRYQLGYVPIGNEFFINKIIYLFSKNLRARNPQSRKTVKPSKWLSILP